MRGVPVWATLIALMEHGKVVVGVVSAPALGPPLVGRARRRRVDRAQPDQGHALQVSAVGRLADASFSFSGLERLGEGRTARPVPRPHEGLLAHPRRSATSGRT